MRLAQSVTCTSQSPVDRLESIYLSREARSLTLIRQLHIERGGASCNHSHDGGGLLRSTIEHIEVGKQVKSMPLSVLLQRSFSACACRMRMGRMASAAAFGNKPESSVEAQTVLPITAYNVTY